MMVMQALAQEGARVAEGAPDFDDWVAARGPGLLRLAYTLTGNTADAEDVVQEALARALPRWDRISKVGNVDAYVRRMVVNGHTSWWRKFRRRESPVEEVRDHAVVGPGEGFDDRHRLWLACQARWQLDSAIVGWCSQGAGTPSAIRRPSNAAHVRCI